MYQWLVIICKRRNIVSEKVTGYVSYVDGGEEVGIECRDVVK